MHACEYTAFPGASQHHQGLTNWHMLPVGKGGSIKIPLDQLRHSSLAAGGSCRASVGESQQHCCKQHRGSPKQESLHEPGQGCLPQPQQPPQMHYVLPPNKEHFLIPSEQTQHAAKGEQSLPAARVPKSKIRATASMCEARQRQGDFARCIQNN